MGLFNSKSSRRKESINDLERNILRRNDILDDENSTPTSGGDRGCIVVVIAMAVIIFIAVALINFAFSSDNKGMTCAEPGCSNKTKQGSNYCWFHSPSTPVKNNSSGGSSSSKNDGSIINGGSSDNSDKKNNSDSSNLSRPK